MPTAMCPSPTGTGAHLLNTQTPILQNNATTCACRKCTPQRSPQHTELAAGTHRLQAIGSDSAAHRCAYPLAGAHHDLEFAQFWSKTASCAQRDTVYHSRRCLVCAAGLVSAAAVMAAAGHQGGAHQGSWQEQETSSLWVAAGWNLWQTA
jgi:hypothetical protein